MTDRLTGTIAGEQGIDSRRRRRTLRAAVGIVALLVLSSGSSSVDRDPPNVAALSNATLVARPHALSLGRYVQGSLSSSFRARVGTLDYGRPLGELLDTMQQEFEALEKSGIGDTSQAAELLGHIVQIRLLRGLGPDPETQRLAQRLIDKREKLTGAEHDRLWSAWMKLGLAQEEAGAFERAIVSFERVLELPGHRTKMWAQLRMVHPLIRLGRYAEARTALDYGVREAARESRNNVASGDKLGSFLAMVGDSESAEVMLRQSLTTMETSPRPGRNPVKRAVLQHNLALTLHDPADTSAALSLLQRSLEQMTETFGTHALVAQVHLSLAHIHAHAGHVSDARVHLESALEIQNAVLPREHPDRAATVVSLANVHEALGDHDASTKLSVAFVAEFGDEPDLPPFDLPFIKASLARWFWKSGMTEQATILAIESERLARHQFKRTVRALSEREALLHYTTRSSAFGLAIDQAVGTKLDPKLTREVWSEVVSSRLVVFEEFARRHHSLFTATGADGPRTHAELVAARERLSAAIHRSSSPPPPTEAPSNLSELILEKERLERQLATMLDDDDEPDDSVVRRIESAIPEDVTLVSFVRYRSLSDAAPRKSDGVGSGADHYAAFVVGKGRGPVPVALGSAARIDAAVAEWSASVATDPRMNSDVDLAESAYRSAARKLRRLIWDPLLPHLGQKSTVFLVADGSLHQVNFATLQDRDGKYLIESDRRLHSLTREQDLLIDPGGKLGGELLAFGGPDFDVDPTMLQSPTSAADDPAAESVSPVYRGRRSPCDDRTGRSFPPLPGAAREVASVGKLWDERRHTVLVGSAADETSFKRLAGRSSTLHVATHGFTTAVSCEAGDAPLLSTGLVLAGANRRFDLDPAMAVDDGILTGEEIVSLDLTGVESAVLSACDSGRGPIVSGEGVIGLSRAFRIAGVQSLVIALWSVEDEAARAWMESYYRARIDGTSRMESVREASLHRLETARSSGHSDHPFNWGAFVGTGHWR